MANILTIPDIHMKAEKILPLVNVALSENKVDTIVLLGDYFDDWNKYNHLETAELIAAWLKIKRKDYKVICLLGNHDVPYLTGNLAYYSNKEPGLAEKLTRIMLEDFKVQMAYEADGWLFSHAGWIDEKALLDIYFKPIEKSYEAWEMLKGEEGTVGISRGGNRAYGGILWADYNLDLAKYRPRTYPRQAVGHTPVPWIYGEIDSKDESYIGLDTMSITSSGRPIGDVSLAIFEDGQPRVIHPEYPGVVEFPKSDSRALTGAEKKLMDEVFDKYDELLKKLPED